MRLFQCFNRREAVTSETLSSDNRFNWGFYSFYAVFILILARKSLHHRRYILVEFVSLCAPYNLSKVCQNRSGRPLLQVKVISDLLWLSKSVQIPIISHQQSCVWHRSRTFQTTPGLPRAT